MKKTLALISSGGGMTCSYSAGVIFALAEKYKLKEPDIAIGSSGSAGTLAYFVAGQYQSIKNIWTNLLNTKKVLNIIRFWKIFNIDYIIDDIFKIEEPLKTSNIYKSKTNLLIPFTNADSGKVEYFSNRETGDIFEALRATKAMPLVYGKLVKINNSHYCDTYLSSNVSLNLVKAKGLGAEKFLVIESSKRNPLIEKGLSLWTHTRNKQFRDEYKNELLHLPKMTYDQNIFVLKPESELKISTLDNKSMLLKETFELGYNETINNKLLKKFLEDFNKPLLSL